MRLWVVCALALLGVTPGESCASNKFTDSGQCCSLCPAGFGVEKPCGKEDTKCAPCPAGKFSSSEDLEPCRQCARCSRSAPLVSACSPLQDTVCQCRAGYFFLQEHELCAPCSKCTRGEGAASECGPVRDTPCQVCAPGTFSEERLHTKPCQTCTRCSDSEVEIRACLPNSDTLCMDKKLHILSRPADADGSRDGARVPGLEEVMEDDESSPSPGTPKFTPQGEGGFNNILVYMSVLAAVVLGLLIYVAYKCWRSCKQKKALSKARAAELGANPEGEKLHTDSGVFLDSGVYLEPHNLQENQPSKGTKRDSKQDTRLYVNLPPHRQEEVERLLQEGGGRGWRQLGAALGYEAEQLDLFGRGEAPTRTLLSNWAQKEGSTLGLLCTALARIDRPDVVGALTGPSQGVSVV